MVIHAIACKICAAKCDEHSGRVCSDCARRIKDLRSGRSEQSVTSFIRERTPLKTEAEKHEREVERM